MQFFLSLETPAKYREINKIRRKTESLKGIFGETGKSQKLLEQEKTWRQKSLKKALSTPPEQSEKRQLPAESLSSETQKTQPGKIIVNGKERAFLLKSEVIELLGDWPKVVDRMLHATRNGTPWLEIVSNPRGASGAEVRVTTESVCRICVQSRDWYQQKPTLE